MNTEEDILKNVGNQLMMAIDFSLVFFFISSIVLLPTFLKIYIYVFSEKKKTHTGLKQMKEVYNITECSFLGELSL